MQRRNVGARVLQVGTVAIAAACAGLVMGPQAANAASTQYHGDLVPPQQGGYYGVPSEIQFGVTFDKNKKGKRVAAFVKRFSSRSVGLWCPNGNQWWMGAHGEGVSMQDHPETVVKVKKGKFHNASFDDYNFGHYEISGQIPKSGPATGTIRITAPNEAQGGTCDSGVVSWTASPTG
jgi:hypothetical protein